MGLEVDEFRIRTCFSQLRHETVYSLLFGVTPRPGMLASGVFLDYNYVERPGCGNVPERAPVFNRPVPEILAWLPCGQTHIISLVEILVVSHQITASVIATGQFHIAYSLVIEYQGKKVRSIQGMAVSDEKYPGLLAGSRSWSLTVNKGTGGIELNAGFVNLSCFRIEQLLGFDYLIMILNILDSH